MSGSVILQSAGIPAVIATIALGAMALPVLFTGLNGGLNCERSAGALTASSPVAAAAPKPTGDVSSNGAPPPGSVVNPRPQADPVPPAGPDRAVLPATDSPAVPAAKEAEKTEAYPKSPPNAPFVANASRREAPLGSGSVLKRPRSGTRTAARPDALGNLDRSRREVPRPSGEGVVAHRSDVPSPAIRPGDDQTDDADSGNPYTDDGFTPRE